MLKFWQKRKALSYCGSERAKAPVVMSGGLIDLAKLAGVLIAVVIALYFIARIFPI